MGMPLELNTMIVTKGREERLNENLFTLTKEGYRLYPLNIPIEVKKTRDGEISGMGSIQKLEMENDCTKIFYQLISLKTTN
ncbi:DUF2584 domain-containing protein [Cytobacillus kochii]|uniref:DUF2584 domain-containing protein n=1 Tax=Cytobacillus kochii TaxID=859143 RepID=UPI00203B8AF6|nr:DUF2584 domain-containing protein [Cytobacillus kochii]MCM3322955.1 DUF2584 domain-containing protein [Cytobacillus kochii]MCM3345351.1 DUF2584 domain-containing protein [Cytobacillus kochii]